MTFGDIAKKTLTNKHSHIIFFTKVLTGRYSNFDTELISLMRYGPEITHIKMNGSGPKVDRKAAMLTMNRGSQSVFSVLPPPIFFRQMYNQPQSNECLIT